MNKVNQIIFLAIVAATVFGGGMASAASADKPAVEKVEGAFPQDFSKTDSLFVETAGVKATPAASYKIKKGEKLREAMERWTKAADYELVWQPTPEDGDIQFAADMAFSSSFEKASGAFFEIVRSQTKFDGKLHSNRVLRVFVANAKR